MDNITHNKETYRLPEHKKRIILEKIFSAMISQKLYLQKQLSLRDLSSVVDVNKNFVSAVINEKTEGNFYHFVNRFRIYAAEKLLSDIKYSHITIEGIANSVGFSSKSVFNPAFKAHTGMTPSEYRQIKLNISNEEEENE